MQVEVGSFQYEGFQMEGYTHKFKWHQNISKYDSFYLALFIGYAKAGIRLAKLNLDYHNILHFLVQKVEALNASYGESFTSINIMYQVFNNIAQNLQNQPSIKLLQWLKCYVDTYYDHIIHCTKLLLQQLLQNNSDLTNRIVQQSFSDQDANDCLLEFSKQYNVKILLVDFVQGQLNKTMFQSDQYQSLPIISILRENGTYYELFNQILYDYDQGKVQGYNYKSYPFTYQVEKTQEDKLFQIINYMLIMQNQPNQPYDTQIGIYIQINSILNQLNKTQENATFIQQLRNTYAIRVQHRSTCNHTNRTHYRTTQCQLEHCTKCQYDWLISMKERFNLDLDALKFKILCSHGQGLQKREMRQIINLENSQSILIRSKCGHDVKIYNEGSCKQQHCAKCLLEQVNQETNGDFRPNEVNKAQIFCEHGIQISARDAWKIFKIVEDISYQEYLRNNGRIQILF